MTAAGRNVNRRQVVFIVKGLALKGHVFSTTDTPARLAEVFREQARYLITNAGITLDEREDELLSGVVRGRDQPARGRGRRQARRTEADAGRAAKPQAPPAPPAAEMKPPAPPQERPKVASKPTASAKPPPVRAGRPAEIDRVRQASSAARADAAEAYVRRRSPARKRAPSSRRASPGPRS